MLNKKCISVVLSVVICIYLTTVSSLTYDVIFENLSHKCSHYSCEICIIIENMLTNLEGKSFDLINTFNSLIISFFIVQVVSNFVLDLKHETLVTKKVCIIN